MGRFLDRGQIFQDSQTLISSQNELTLYLRKMHNDEQIFTKYQQLKLKLFHEGYVLEKISYLLLKMSYGGSNISALYDEIRDPWRNLVIWRYRYGIYVLQESWKALDTK